MFVRREGGTAASLQRHRYSGIAAVESMANQIETLMSADDEQAFLEFVFADPSVRSLAGLERS